MMKINERINAYRTNSYLAKLSRLAFHSAEDVEARLLRSSDSLSFYPGPPPINLVSVQEHEENFAYLFEACLVARGLAGLLQRNIDKSRVETEKLAKETDHQVVAEPVCIYDVVELAAYTVPYQIFSLDSEI